MLLTHHKDVIWKPTLMKLKPIAQQIVVIVGASSGIGRETALRFAKKGAKVVVAARSQSGLETLVEEIKQLGEDAIAPLPEFNLIDRSNSPQTFNILNRRRTKHPGIFATEL